MEESWTYLADITKGWFPTVIPSGFKALVALTFTVFFLFFVFLLFHLFTYLLISYINIVIVLAIIVEFFFHLFAGYNI